MTHAEWRPLRMSHRRRALRAALLLLLIGAGLAAARCYRKRPGGSAWRSPRSTPSVSAAKPLLPVAQHPSGPGTQRCQKAGLYGGWNRGGRDTGAWTHPALY